MSTISSMADPRADAGGGALTMATAAVKRWLVAYITWRVEQGAIALLHSMTDRELADMGLTRSEIARVVQGPGCERSCRTCSVAEQCGWRREPGLLPNSEG